MGSTKYELASMHLSAIFQAVEIVPQSNFLCLDISTSIIYALKIKKLHRNVDLF